MLIMRGRNEGNEEKLRRREVERERERGRGKGGGEDEECAQFTPEIIS